ncbi:superkiller complex protein 8 [Calliphora vicina]|uniref:superkiller complex protein 8 n=1 Tax=Calliphora vicina TaxID=7373 RepID=UPI00325A47BB
MFSVLHKEEAAHEDGIWSCAWGRTQPEKPAEEEKTEKDPEANREFIIKEDTPEPLPVDFIVTGGLDDLVKVWDIREDNTLKLRHQLKGHSLGVVSVAVSSDGKTIASSSLDSSLCFWDSQSGQQQHLLAFGPVDLWSVAFSPCDKYVISGSNEGKISMYSVETGKVEQVLDAQNGKFTLSIAYSPDGKYIASGAIDGIITIFDVAAGKVAQTLEGHAMPVRSLCFSPNSQMLLTASDDGHMKLYDVVHSDVAGTLSGHASWVLSVSFSEDGKHFASSSSDCTVKIWDFAERKCMHTFSEHSDQAWGVKYSPGNDKVISVSEDKSLNVYNCPPNIVV